MGKAHDYMDVVGRATQEAKAERAHRLIVCSDGHAALCPSYEGSFCFIDFINFAVSSSGKPITLE